MKNNLKSTFNLPRLIFTKKNLKQLIEKLVSDDTLIVCDNYNYPFVNRLPNVFFVKNNSLEEAKIFLDKISFKEVLAIGGCTSLDIGRFFAKDKSLIVIPTILSTSCISVNRSILYFDGKNNILKTSCPEKTIISLSLISETDPFSLSKWSSSGFGDLFANISASINFQYLNGDIRLNKIKENVKEIFLFLNWVTRSFKSFDLNCLIKLAKHSHLSSLQVIIRDDLLLSSGGEHSLYHHIVLSNRHNPNMKATHGQLVSIGTLLSSRIYYEKTGSAYIHNLLLRAYKKLGLPSSYEDLKEIGVTKDILIFNLNKMKDENNFIANYFIDNDFKILEKIFQEVKGR